MDVVKIAGAGLFAAAGLAFACPSLAQDSAAVQAARPADSAVPPAPPSPATPPSPPEPAMPASPGSPERAETPVRLQFEIRDPDHPGAMKTVKIVLSTEDAARAGAALKRVMIEHHAQDEALRDVQPKIDAAMAAVAKARPEIEKALADVAGKSTPPSPNCATICQGPYECEDRAA